VKANGDTFQPQFVVTAANPTAIWFERTYSPYYADVVPGPITELHVTRGTDAAVAVTLRGASGEHICGPVPAAVTQSGNAFSFERLGDSDFVNLPYHIIAGNSAGDGVLQFVVGDLQAALRIVVD